MRRGWTTWVVGSLIAASGFAPMLLAQGSESPLARLRIDGKKVGWDGVELGMSVVQVERRVGTALAPSASGAGGCGAYYVDVERGTLRLTLGLPSNRPGAKVETLYVHFEGYQVLAKRDDLIAELKRVAPNVAFLPAGDSPNLPESETADPSYVLPGAEGHVARLEPGRGLWLGLRDCAR